MQLNLARLLAAVLLLAAFNLPVAAQSPATINICDRHPDVEAAILAELDLTAADCAAVPADRMAAIALLNLHNRNIASLRQGDFDDLTALETLDLAGNRLTTLPSGIFDKLAALKTLYLQRNALATLPSGIFDKLAALETLYLRWNWLAGLTAEHALFANLPNTTLFLASQSEPPSPPPCQPNGGFPTCPAETEPEPDPPAPPETEPEPEPGPEPEPPVSPEPDPPADGDLAGRIAALERKLAALERQAALDADESRETDAVHRHLIDGAAERLDAIEENMPPRRLRLWMPPPEE